MSLPALPDNCWPVDTSCDESFEDLDGDLQDRAIALAASTMRALTLYLVGGCPITVRPCDVSRCAAPAEWFGSGSFYPVNWAGTWSNCGCQTGCLHNGLDLGGVVGPIDSVKIDGVVLDPSMYAVINTSIVRTDGQPWPTTNDLTKPDTEAGTWSITYLPAHPVDGLGAYAAGVLAVEYAKACGGSDCRLPDNVVTIARAGIQMQITPGSFPDGFTGIQEVDAYLRRWNPYGLRTPATVWSPSMRKPSIYRTN